MSLQILVLVQGSSYVGFCTSCNKRVGASRMTLELARADCRKHDHSKEKKA